MKTLNELTPKERLKLYEKALVDWTERPNDEDAFTDWGLCLYFEYAIEVKVRLKEQVNLCEEWMTSVEDKIFCRALGKFGDPLPRIAALKAMIKELEDVA